MLLLTSAARTSELPSVKVCVVSVVVEVVDVEDDVVELLLEDVEPVVVVELE